METIKAAFQTLRSNKIRSALTMLGIIIGISSVITIVSIGQGLRSEVMSQFDKIGKNIINLNIKFDLSLYVNPSTDDYFTLEDGQMLMSKIPEANGIVMSSGADGTAYVGKNSKISYIAGITADYPAVSGTEVIAGRFFSQEEEDNQKSVAVLDSYTARYLFGSPEAAIGKKIKTNCYDNIGNFTIVGVTQRPGEQFASMNDAQTEGQIFYPITMAEEVSGFCQINQISITLSDMSNAQQVGARMVRLLERAHRNSGIYTATVGFKEIDQMNQIFNTMTLAVGAIAAISLLVGGIGVMNIMLVSVTERTREIGIRKALGATRRDIRIQFLTESVILCAIGGLTGMLLGIGLGRGLGSIVGVTAQVSTSVVLIAVLFSSAIGIFFGIYPSNKAAKLDPIVALRYE